MRATRPAVRDPGKQLGQLAADQPSELDGNRGPQLDGNSAHCATLEHERSVLARRSCRDEARRLRSTNQNSLLCARRTVHAARYRPRRVGRVIEDHRALRAA
jgi:hypothetical protein